VRPSSQPEVSRPKFPRPANLPVLSSEDLLMLRLGERVQHQVRHLPCGLGACLRWYSTLHPLSHNACRWNEARVLGS
jgi:hypothetical protein